MHKYFLTWMILLIGVPGLYAQYPGQHREQVKAPMKAFSFDLKDVRLLDSRFRQNMEREGSWILSLPNERLLHSFYVNAGMLTDKKDSRTKMPEPLGGWEQLDMELRGHSVGHILSGLSLLFAATGEEQYKRKGDSIVSALAAVQRVLDQDGYLSAYPQNYIDRNIAGEAVWAPWYTLHKIMAGLLDMYWNAGNKEALEVAQKMASWSCKKLSPLSEEALATMLRNEFGGMNEAFFNLYSITGDSRHLELARKFYHHAVLDPLAQHEDKLKGLHANTIIPKIVGEARAYELTNDAKDSTIAAFFWNTVVRDHTYAHGGNSDKEHFFSPGKISEHLTGNTGETCNTYNMLKITRHLFSWYAEAKYADYYEQALYNHILGQQDPATGMVCYFSPMAPGAYRLYSTPDQSFWCCVGSGFESQAKFGEGIYYHDANGVFVNLFIPSELTWMEKGIKIVQETKYPEEATTRLTVYTGSDSSRSAHDQSFSLYIRYPGWATNGAVIRVNGKPLKILQSPGSYVTINRVWKSGDKVEVTYPMSLRLVPAPDNPQIAAIAYGPVVLAAQEGTEGMVSPAPYHDPQDPYQYYGYDYHIPSNIVHTLTTNGREPSTWLTPVTGRPLTFVTVDGIASKVVRLVPYYEVHRERYVVYWNLVSAQGEAGAASFYNAEIKDPRAVYLIKGQFPVKADGIADDAPALQEAIDQVEKQTKAGIVFVPEGVYRLGTTVNIWKGIRIIGYGKRRPVFLLAANTPGFQSGEGKYMVRFCDRRTPAGTALLDGTPGTLFSGVSNVDLTIEDGNPAAVAVRFHVAQHSFLEHIHFNIGSARAAVEEMGNEITDCHFFGGEWAISTGLPAAGWQSMLLDCHFAGQRKWAILSKDAGLTVIRCQFKNLAAGIKVLQGNNEKLFVKDSRFENIAEPAIDIGNYYDPRTQVTLDNLQFCNVPVSINFELLPGVITPVSRDSLRRKEDGPVYRIGYLSHGLHIDVEGAGEARRRFVTSSSHSAINAMDDLPGTDIPLTEQASDWVNILNLGAKGDGVTDDTKVFSDAIKKYRTIYVPQGRYCISETLVLHEKTCLIGLHPAQTMFVLKDSIRTFSDTTRPKAMLVAPEGGQNIVTGIGMDPGYNPGAVAIQWMSGEHSYLNDVHIPSRHSAVKGVGQYYGIWVTNGGGGVFKSSWLPNELARNGFFVNNTSTRGAVYLLSVEHHKNVEVQLDNTANWTFYALQTEEDAGSDQSFAASIDNCHHILFINQYCYRRALMPGPFISAFKMTNSDQIMISGMHSFSSGPFPYDNTIYIEDKKIVVPQSEFSQFTLR